MRLHNLYQVECLCLFLLGVELFSTDSTLNETPLLCGRRSNEIGWVLLPFSPMHFENRNECPSGKILKIFRACQVRQSSLATCMTVLLRTRTFLLLQNCLEAGMGVLLLNSLLNSLGQRLLFCCV